MEPEHLLLLALFSIHGLHSNNEAGVSLPELIALRLKKEREEGVVEEVS